MDCQQYQDALNAAALGAESGAEAQAFRLHLEICEACRREFARRSEFLGSLDLQLQARFEAVPSPDFDARLRRRITSESERAPRPVLSWLPLLAGATAFAALLAFLHYRGVISPHPHEANPVQIASTPGAQPSQAAAANHPSALRYANSAAAPSARETPSLHPVIVAATASSSPALRVRIDRGELYATVRFTEAIAEGRIDATPLVSAAHISDDSAGAKPLEIPLIDVQPMDKPNSEAGPSEN
jgi:anti-sigma factor RsiW